MSAVRRAWARVMSFFRSDELDREFEEEAEAHLALATDDYVRCGMPRDEAERLARRKFGLARAAKDAHRDARGFVWLEALLFDARLAFRSLSRDRVFALTAVTTLVIAITLNVTVFTVRDAMLFRGLPGAISSERLAETFDV